MLIGLMADSHDNLPALHAAVRVFNERQVGFVIHAGDFIAPFSLEPLEGLRCPWIGVFGNNDGEQRGLTQTSKGRIQPAPYELNLDGKKFLVVHDISNLDLSGLARQGTLVVVHGHTHKPSSEKTGQGVLLVNPGELGGWRYGVKNVAILDTVRLESESITIEA